MTRTQPRRNFTWEIFPKLDTSPQVNFALGRMLLHVLNPGAPKCALYEHSD